MAIIYPLDPPPRVRSVLWREIDVQADVASPFTGQSQIVVFPGQWAACTITLAVSGRADAQACDSWLSKLKGMSGTFRYGNPFRRLPLGSAAGVPGTPLVRGAGQTGDAVVIDGLPHSAAGYLKAGDYLQIPDGSTPRLYKALEDVGTDSGGIATVPIWPNLRSSPADNAAVVVSGAVGLFHRASPVTDWTAGPDSNTQQRSFDAKEFLS